MQKTVNLVVTVLSLLVCCCFHAAMSQRADTSISWVSCPAAARSAANSAAVNDDNSYYNFQQYDPFNLVPPSLKFKVPNYENKNKRSIEQAATFTCGFIKVPLVWTNTSDPRTITLGVKKLSVSNANNRKGVIVLMEGGPGASSSNSFTNFANLVRSSLNDQYDIIVRNFYYYLKIVGVGFDT